MMSCKAFYVFVIFVISFLLLPVDVQAQAEDKKQNEVFIEAKTVDYTNHILNADIKISLHLQSNKDYTYLILPIKNSPGMSFFVEPNSKKETILHGYLGLDGNFIVQFPPLNQSAEYFFTFTEVQMPIIETSNDEAFGYYSFSFDSITEDISRYSNSLISIDTIHIIDKNQINSYPSAIQENSKNSLLFSFSDIPYDINIYISKQPTNSGFLIPIILGVGCVIIGIVAGMGLQINVRIKNQKKYKILFRGLSVFVVILQIAFFGLYIYPNGFYNELTFMSAVSTVFGITIGIGGVIFFDTRKINKYNSE